MIRVVNCNAIENQKLLSSSSDECSQDYAIETGSIIKKDGKYYAFYTGHNPNFPSSFVKTKERIMLSTSSSLEEKFSKDFNFQTIYAPVGEGFDEEDNFRDPFVYYDSFSKEYLLIISARTSRGVLIYYRSIDLYHWKYEGILYDGDSTVFYMMETADLFLIDRTYYLLFSDIDSKNVYYRKNRLDGNGFYGGKVILDNFGDHYIFGWINRYENNNDQGKDLAGTIPHTIKSYMDKSSQPIVKHSQWGIVENINGNNSSYYLSSLFDGEINNFLFEPIHLSRFKISLTISYKRSLKDFGLMIGACDGYNQFMSLRFLPS
ncbi:unnamed protein product [Didymodactylos carnosus]|uniref:beta-fructofuranosidase n=1 Tax=Didymodactylos carnosus TaxID=1234261 RepID=A0A815RWV9_9BILA|nr:unnamed protein product [Didymodactylos carnosus]CAF1480559.1 unnamed protein product [Didymodactylos carnosus]CAF4015628.1 unnamed protein product [Didymodactylos carnosus]CAF4345714.1 unnamed protein product [Didymodactylos carnosus]